MNLFNGDCLEKLKLISDNSIDLILADPPYGITECAWDKVIPFEPLWEELNRVAKQNTAIIIFGVEPFSSQLRMSNLKNYRYDLIYEKPHATGFLNVNRQPMRAHENISVFYKKQPTYNPKKQADIQENHLVGIQLIVTFMERLKNRLAMTQQNAFHAVF